MSQLAADVPQLAVDVSQLGGALSQLQKDGEQLQMDVSQQGVAIAQLQKDGEQLHMDVAQLLKDMAGSKNNDAKVAEELVRIRVAMTRLATEQLRFATREEMAAMKGELRSDIRSVESNLKGWKLGIALTLVTMTSAMFYSLHSTLKAVPGWTAQQVSQQVAPPGKQVHRRRRADAYFLPG